MRTFSDNRFSEYEILDTLPNHEFDHLLELIAGMFGTGMAAITFLDNYRQWYRFKVGIDAESYSIEQCFCRYTIKQPGEVLVVPDALLDDRFKDGPLTQGAPFIRFYAGTALVNEDGLVLGALCISDANPKNLSLQQVQMLKQFGLQIVQLMDLRKRNLKQEQTIENTRENLLSLEKTMDDMLFDISHKLRHPITSLEGLVPVLQDADANRADFDQALEYLLKSIRQLDLSSREFSKLLENRKTGDSL